MRVGGRPHRSARCRGRPQPPRRPRREEKRRVAISSPVSVSGSRSPSLQFVAWEIRCLRLEVTDHPAVADRAGGRSNDRDPACLPEEMLDAPAASLRPARAAVVDPVGRVDRAAVGSHPVHERRVAVGQELRARAAEVVDAADDRAQRRRASCRSRSGRRSSANSRGSRSSSRACGLSWPGCQAPPCICSPRRICASAAGRVMLNTNSPCKATIWTI